MDTIRFIQARNYTRVTSVPRRIDLIVLHDMESPEHLRVAEDVAAWAAGPNAPRASWHFGIDGDSIVQSVLVKDVAWHAPGANHNGIGIEHAGRARQTRAEWLDPFGRSMLSLSALLCANLCREHNIPAELRGPSELRQGLRGITTHAACTIAFGGNHTDPGPNFPHDVFFRELRAHLKPAVLRNWPIPIPAWFWLWASWKLKGRPAGLRPASAPRLIPLWAHVRYLALVRARKVAV